MNASTHTASGTYRFLENVAIDDNDGISGDNDISSRTGTDRMCRFEIGGRANVFLRAGKHARSTTLQLPFIERARYDAHVHANHI